ncbi:ribose 5-phosphate isomerase B [Paenibacillus sp. UNCCL117]|uniref:ribose 5-phosphate isomerase B n=1 Tax=unclassified Paenibacillus TaxID=185978 RepID=UPI00088935CA|nr:MULTISPECIES: ribose 5-phosphate isomerase B [unclassified Paenibacillus]SDD12103.1 ribose-5-phosphate isomerase [Paenibacillus sp. cl123]SFW33720.1 ribose 5-phosphate isomerase B [Paenibacillus sp. UNCCL117]
MKIAIGADEAGYAMKEIIKQFLEERKMDFVDFGPSDMTQAIDYPDVGFAVAEEIAHGHYDRGILICGTGIGMTITADKVPGIRAALCHDTYSAERAMKSNNAQVLTMGARVIGPELAKHVVRAWLEAEFDGGSSGRKVQKIMDGEQRLFAAGGGRREVNSCSSSPS